MQHSQLDQGKRWESGRQRVAEKVHITKEIFRKGNCSYLGRGRERMWQEQKQEDHNGDSCGSWDVKLICLIHIF